MKNILIISILFLSSCQIYTGVILDRVMPGTRKDYPIKDTLACAIKVKFEKNQREIWCRDVICQDDYDIGDTIQFYITNKRGSNIFLP